MFYLFLGTGR